MRTRLEDCLAAATAIHGWVPEHNKDAIMNDLMVESAYLLQFERIGESLRVARDLDDYLEIDFPEIHEWISLRHHLVHDYREIDFDLLWQYATVDVPQLITQLRRLIRR